MCRNNPDISVAELKQRLNNKEMLKLLDVREPIEFHSYNIGGQNLSVNKLQQNLHLLQYNKSEEIIVICTIGRRSKTAQSILEDNGYHNIRNLKGGLLALQRLK